MRLTLNRHPPGFTCVIGDLLVEGEMHCHTLEDLPHEEKIPGETCIPPGVYAVELTSSPAVIAGHMWSPHAAGLLPHLVAVPGFEGIRIHAGNTDKDTRGCILVGGWNGGEFLFNSRKSLESLMDVIEVAAIGRQPITIEVFDSEAP